MMPGQERPDVNAGGKIIMPPSSLESLSRLNISFPMLFKVENKAKGRFIILRGPLVILRAVHQRKNSTHAYLAKMMNL